MNIFVTGGAGYIGSVSVDLLLRRGHAITVYDSLVTGNREALPDRVKLIHADLGDLATLGRAFASEEYEAVIHLAGSVDPRESMLDPSGYFENNVSKTLGLLGVLARSRIKKFIFASTYSIYQSNAEIHAEDSPTAPQSVYAQTKLMIEQALEWYQRTYGLGVGILRYANVGGATNKHGELHPHESHIIPRVLAVALGIQSEISIYGQNFPTKDGTAVRDFVHVSDIAAANQLVTEKIRPGDLLRYNVSNGIGHTVGDILQIARKVTGHEIPAVVVDRNPGDPPGLIASPFRIQRDLGWAPSFPQIEEIIRSAWDWRRVRHQTADKRD